QRGSIEGVVKDTSGAVLPGVTVEARSAAGAALTTVTDGTGTYRFPSLLPGTYEISTNLVSFKPEKVSIIVVPLGQVKKVDFALKLATLTEQVTVIGESPVIDVKQSTRATNIRSEQVELLPHNRDFTSLITQAPGANFEAKSTNDNLSPMIDGASAAENRYIIDGMETTSIFNGLSAKAVVADFVEEVQVKSSGYPAEYGGSTGGVINVITKSGTNRFSGMVLGYWQGSSVNGTCGRPGITPLSSVGATTGSTVGALPDNSSQPCGSNPTLRLTIANSNVAEYWTYPKDTVNRYEPGISLGGPVMKDKAWFF